MMLLSLAISSIAQPLVENYETIFNKKRFVVIFTNPECKACEFYTPTFAMLRQKLPSIQFYQFDCSLDYQLCVHYKIDKVPQICFFEYGKFARYEGYNSVQMIRRWIISRL